MRWLKCPPPPPTTPPREDELFGLYNTKNIHSHKLSKLFVSTTMSDQKLRVNLKKRYTFMGVPLIENI